MSSRGFPITKSIRQFRRTEADKRQKEYDKLTLQQKLDRLPPSPKADKQRKRLMSQLNKPVSTKLVETDPTVVSLVSDDEKLAIKAEIKAKKFNKNI